MKKSLALVLSCFCLTGFTDNDFIKRQDVNQFIKQTHDKFQLSEKYLTDALSKVKLQKRVIRSIKNPKEKGAWTDYRSIFITPKRIAKGVAFIEAHKSSLQKAENQYGVPKEVIVAILGVETFFGQKQGSYRVIDSLSTLAFNFKKRSRFFKKELANFLKLCDEQAFEPTSVYGSYAGAIGQPQFMPSSYRHYAVDFNGNGKKDLRSNVDDAIGSIANYLSVHGWQKNEGVTEPAITKGNNFKKLVTKSKKAKYSLSKLARYGITPQSPGQAKKGSVLALKSPKQTEYWLAYPNFFVITKYNTSEQYALAVYLLAQKLKEQQK